MTDRDQQPTNLRKVAHAHAIKLLDQHEITITDLVSSLVMYMFHLDPEVRHQIIEQGGKLLAFAQMGAEFEPDMNYTQMRDVIEGLLSDAPKT